MAKPDVSQYQSFDQITRRLDDIVGAVRDRDVSLERSLDLFDEAIALGSKAVELVDATDFSPEEKAMLADGSTTSDQDAEKLESPTQTKGGSVS
ncbi:exodeoxyribonuclease VII small subunit [Olsenella sp. Marseille-P4559]|uniref:exodeoxyribonuclease VII small subunit n=1 Tax=Olsenella sp. Marseille-P4559 TaxID=2364795 RepID=UPI0010314E0B|nr:exodeoxyribonuclease VII small subunit [Olsenella sp. Marseille-P4559]